MQNSEYFELLFHSSREVTPYLSGHLANQTDCYSYKADPHLHISKDNSEQIKALYERLSQATPEAGSAYWLTRTWDLLCWQPVYIAFISIYQLRALPNIKEMSQEVKSDFVAGYTFHHSDLTFGSNEDLISSVAQQLSELFSSYQEDISQWTRIRPGFTNHLLADGLLNCIVKLQANWPKLSNEYLLEQAKLWLEAFSLPNKHLSSLQIDVNTKQLRLVRTSCCLVYKCDGRKLCPDCPRHPDNKR
ncbi:siderophore ferric iron reductase [Aliivibrio fischeri]|uniref:siderophore ferric iron reductase n=1 Tax=Aliivibrio fischeri TaxID=668 RepID=UPI0007C599F1|nr:siderophore ferric iron reductase [Aliivibrio fischeri]